MKAIKIVDHELSVKVSGGDAGVLKLRQEGRRFTVIGLTLNDPELMRQLSDGDNVCFGFDPANATEVLDTSSDAYQCFNTSTEVKYGDVTLSCTEMRASCIEDIKAALTRVKINPFNPEAI